MNSAGTYEVDIEVRRVGQAIPGLKIFCDGWKREALALAFFDLCFIVIVYAFKKSTYLCTLLLLSDTTNLQDFEAVGGLSQL